MVAALKTKVPSLNCYDGDSVSITDGSSVSNDNSNAGVMAMVGAGQRIDDGRSSNDDGNIATM